MRLSLVALFLLGAWAPAQGDQTNHNFAIWEREIAAYERMDATNPPPSGGIEFVGSSTIRLWKTLQRDFAGAPVYNRGFGGSEIVDSTHFASRIIFPYAPRKIFFRAGGNDLANGKSAEEVFADFQDFARQVHARLPATEIYYIAWNPTPARWRQHEAEKALNAMVAGFIHDKPYLKYIETYDLPLDAAGRPRPGLFMADHLHFNQAGYRLLAARVRPYVFEK
ncbi:MAG TPA: GDSL-type esterase/lipase family protein [Candidatus Acidoferrales bacterium]|nr:GDSL-type esterase/lipase family protein [Candidatus Acidoferrales bacterium]